MQHYTSFFQPTQTLGEGRLGFVQTIRCTAQVFEFGNGFKIVKVAKIHFKKVFMVFKKLPI